MPKKGDFFYVPYVASQAASVFTGYLVTGAIAAPFILIDWLVSGCISCLTSRFEDEDDNWDTRSIMIDEKRTQEQKALYAINVPYLFNSADIDKASHKIVSCSYFGKVTYGLVASGSGLAASAVTSLSTFVVASVVAVAVAAVALSAIAVLVLIGALFAGIGLGCTCYKRGPVETAKSIASYAKGLM